MDLVGTGPANKSFGRNCIFDIIFDFLKIM